MKVAWNICLSFVLVGSLLIGCSDDDGGGDVCKDSFSKQKACAEALDCSTLTGADKMGCDILKQTFGQMNYDQVKALCEQQTPGECACDGEKKTEAEKINSCTLDPKTCACPESSQPDGGTPQEDGGATGACTSADDKAAVDGTKTWGGKTIKQITGEQAACLTDPDPATCIVAAVKTAVNSEVTDGCITCYAQSAMCTVQNCMAAGCVDTPTSDACIKCQCGDNTASVNCIDAFATCSGQPPTTTCP